MKVSRVILRDKEARKVLKEFEQFTGLTTFKAARKIQLEAVDVDGGLLYFLDGYPSILRIRDETFPTLFLAEAIRMLPSFTVDMGAVPHICNGADVMAPGVRGIEGDFDAGRIAQVLDEKFRKPIAVGVTKVDSKIARRMVSGKLVKTIHYVGDRFWETGKLSKHVKL